MTDLASLETYFDPCRRLPDLFFDGFYNALYGRFKKPRNVDARWCENLSWCIEGIVNIYPLSLILPDRISCAGSFSLRPKGIKYDLEGALKPGFVILSKYLVITSMSLFVPNVDRRSFSRKYH